MHPILHVRNVSKSYGTGDNRVVAVDAVTLAVKTHQLLLIMGPSGSGKTTLLSIMGCILRPTEGEVFVESTAVTDMSEDRLPDVRKKYFGFVFQSFNLFPSLRAVENVELVMRLKHCDKRTMRQEALALLDKVGLRKRWDFYPADMSGGEKQRVAFARALAGNPPVILADEPTANLDSRTGMDLLKLLGQLAKEYGKAIVMVSHDPKAETLADRVVFLEDGRLRA